MAARPMCVALSAAHHVDQQFDSERGNCERNQIGKRRQPAWCDEFDGAALDPELQTLRIPFDETLGSLSARPGYLRLYGNDSLNSTFTQSTVARRWQHFAFRAETRMEFAPKNF